MQNGVKCNDVFNEKFSGISESLRDAKRFFDDEEKDKFIDERIPMLMKEIEESNIIGLEDAKVIQDNYFEKNNESIKYLEQ